MSLRVALDKVSVVKRKATGKLTLIVQTHGASFLPRALRSRVIVEEALTWGRGSGSVKR